MNIGEMEAAMTDAEMTVAWLHRGGAARCLLVFSGWGMDAAPFAPLASGGVDVCLLFGYRRLALPELPELRDYGAVAVLAWSFGVWMAARLSGPDGSLCGGAVRPEEIIALGGTLNPVDAKRGLAPEQFGTILADFGEARLAAFHQAMFDDPAHLACFLTHRPRRALAELRAELAFLHDASLAEPVPPDIFSRRVVTARDRIFSGRNQLRAWGRDAACSKPWPHFPFYRFRSWGELLAALRDPADQGRTDT